MQHMRTPEEQNERARQETTNPHSKPLRERKPVFSVADLIEVRAPKAGDGMGALATTAGSITELQKRTVQWWLNRGAGIREIARITALRPATIQDILTDLARESGPITAETRDELQSRLQGQLDWQRTDLQRIIDDPGARAPDRIAAHRALLLLARTQADIAGIHRTADTELARSIETLLSAGRSAGQPVMVAVAPTLAMAQADDRAQDAEGERLRRSERAATARHYARRGKQIRDAARALRDAEADAEAEPPAADP
jgi:hypothetical protein